MFEFRAYVLCQRKNYGSNSQFDKYNIKELNKLHSLEGNRKGQFSISINEQWRICFHFSEGNISNVEIVDYH